MSLCNGNVQTEMLCKESGRSLSRLQSLQESQLDIQQVCRHFENVPNITFICYTKSLPYVIKYINDNGALPSNLALRFSVWADTNPVHIALAEKYGIAIYTADDEQNITEETYPKYDVCRCSDCATCGHCWSKYDKYHKIVCAIH